jgi:hypothetical protein
MASRETKIAATRERIARLEEDAKRVVAKLAQAQKALAALEQN